ncbi:MAG: hypothetical protein ACJ746_18645 [Bryobacteraceae bacterium]
MSRTTGKPMTKQRNSATVHPGQFALEIRVRGKPDVLHTEVCRGLEHAIGMGEKWFRAFEARNPWFVQDSKRRKIFVLLDPETETLLSS